MLPTKIQSRIQTDDNGCWNWIGATRPDGYGIMYNKEKGKPQRAHRVTYSLLVEPLIEGLVIDHLCRNRRCVNPNHLRQTTQRENTLSGVGPAAKKHAQTECVKGHKFDKSNTYIHPKRGTRHCRTCTNETSARRRAGELNTGLCACGGVSYARKMCQSCYMHWYRRR